RQNALDERRRLLAATARRGLADAGERGQGERSGERDARGPAPPGSEPVGDERAAHEVALRELAPEGEGEVARRAILDPDGDGRDAVVAGELDQRPHVGKSARVL